jgi:phenylalanyl-tRNA synthetase alpha chain
LNIPENHPARDLWDTLWVKSSHLPSLTSHLLFRTHTSVFQIPILKKLGVSVRAVIMGKVFRYEATDKTHDFEFYQLDGLSVSKNSNLANLRYVVEKFFERFFHQEIKVRFRPGYFPFVEPGLEIDLGCIFCNKIRTDANLKRTNTNITRTNTNLKRTNANQVCDSSFPVRDSLYGKVRESSFQVLDGSREKDCPVCKNSGFVEIAGAGMVHNFVLKSAGIDYKKYQGYAFGFGVDRLIMLKHNIDDIRILHSSDLRFIRQL